MSSASAIKLHTGQISMDRRAAPLKMFNRLVSESFTVLAVTGVVPHCGAVRRPASA